MSALSPHCPIFRMSIRTLAATCGAFLLVQSAISPVAFAADAPGHWVVAWATALQAIPQRDDLPPLYRAPDVAGRTVRQIVYPTLSGNSARLHISNEYGRSPLVIEDLRIARSAGGAASDPKRDPPLAGCAGAQIRAHGRPLDRDRQSGYQRKPSAQRFAVLRRRRREAVRPRRA